MALHSKWSSGHLIFHDGTNDILEIKDGTDGVEFHQLTTYPTPTSVTATGGGVTLTAASNRIQFVTVSTSSTSGDDLFLPASSGAAGVEFKIFNVSSSAYGITVYQTGSTAAAIANIDQNQGGIFISNGSSGNAAWGVLIGAST